MWQELAPLHREQKHVHVRCNKHSLRTGQSATNREGYGYGYGQQSWGRRNLVLKWLTGFILQIRSNLGKNHKFIPGP